MSTQSHLGFYNGHHYHHNLGIENAERTTAFASINDKSSANKIKSKTKLCRSVEQGIPCKYGSKCTYAHSASELVQQECAFGETCRTRFSKTNPCKFAHTKRFVPEPAKNPNLAEEVRLREEARIKALVEEKKKREEEISLLLAEEEKRKQRDLFVINLEEEEEKDNEVDEIDEVDEILLSSLDDLEEKISVEDEIEDESIKMTKVCDETKITYISGSTITQFKGWSGNALSPVQISQPDEPTQDELVEAFIEQEELEEQKQREESSKQEWQEQSARQQEYQLLQQKLLADQQQIILQQQELISSLINTLNTPCIPMLLSLAQVFKIFNQ